MGETLDQIAGQTKKAAGRIRLLIPRFAIPVVLTPKPGTLHREYPEIVLDVITDNSRRDIVAEGFDAGIHFGEFIEKDMIAVRLAPDQRSAIANGKLIRVLQDWCQPFPGFFIYYPGRRQQTAALTALVSILRSEG